MLGWGFCGRNYLFGFTHERISLPPDLLFMYWMRESGLIACAGGGTDLS